MLPRYRHFFYAEIKHSDWLKLILWHSTSNHSDEYQNYAKLKLVYYIGSKFQCFSYLFSLSFFLIMDCLVSFFASAKVGSIATEMEDRQRQQQQQFWKPKTSIAPVEKETKQCSLLQPALN